MFAPLSDRASVKTQETRSASFKTAPSETKRRSTMIAIRRFVGAAACILCVLSAVHSEAFAQDTNPLQPGEAYSTRFSGTTAGNNSAGETIPVIDLSGVVGSIIDLRAPGHEPKGEHWLTEPQRAPLTAAEVGQVFGIAMDDWDPANIYVAATSAFGLHLTDEGEWMPGMWGTEGGPGTIYKLDGETGYRPQVFADITLEGRANTGAGLGNIVYDSEHGQLIVSDLETGMIHRIDAETGEDLERFDHGVDGRSSFIDAETGEYSALPIAEFDPDSAANIEDCDDDFSQTPECWNVADYRRRVWGLGLFASDEDENLRLYYAIWSSDPLGADDWAENPEDQQNTIWSIGIADDGSFDIQDVRRELTLPPFDNLGTQTGTAVSDIAFSQDGTMLLAERGGLRNFGLDAPQAFATPHVSRVLQYKLRQAGIWEPIARFDVGFYDRVNDGAPYLRANGAGGVDFGYGYTAKGVISPTRPGRMMWASGNYLCSPQGPCNDPDGGPRQDSDQVHGLQGTPRNADSTLLPDGAMEEYPDEGDPYPARGPNSSYLIDTDFNIDGFGRINEDEAERDDASRVGDIEIFRAGGAAPPPVPLHAKQLSAFHNKFQSNAHDKVKTLPIHTKAKSHNKVQSTAHIKPWSHHKPGSHKKAKSFLHVKPFSHFKPNSVVHVKPWSHHKPGSHKKAKSFLHVKPFSHYKPKSKVHVKPWTHFKPGSHKKAKSFLHVKPFSHYKPKSLPLKQPKPIHVKPWSHFKPKSHKKSKSQLHVKPHSHYKPKSLPIKQPKPIHVKPWSHNKPGSHKKAKSLLHVKPHSHYKPKSLPIKQPKPIHVKPWSHNNPGSHKKAKSLLHVKPHSHFKPKSLPVKQPAPVVCKGPLVAVNGKCKCRSRRQVLKNGVCVDKN